MFFFSRFFQQDHVLQSRISGSVHKIPGCEFLWIEERAILRSIETVKIVSVEIVVQLTSTLPCMSCRTDANGLPSLPETQVYSCRIMLYLRQDSWSFSSVRFHSSSGNFEVKIEKYRYAPTIDAASRAPCKNCSVFILPSIISGNCALPLDPVSAQPFSRTVESEDDMFYFQMHAFDTRWNNEHACHVQFYMLFFMVT